MNIQEDKIIAIILLIGGSFFIGLGTKNFAISLGVLWIVSSIILLLK